MRGIEAHQDYLVQSSGSSKLQRQVPTALDRAAKPEGRLLRQREGPARESISIRTNIPCPGDICCQR